MNAVPIVCAVAALPVGWFAGVLVDRVPDRLPLRPLPGVRVEGRYLAVHIVILGLFVALGFRFDDATWIRVVGYLLLAAMLVTVSAIDIACFRLPDRIVLPTLVVSAAIVVAGSLREGRPAEITYAAAGAALYFGVLLVFHLISPGGMGFGDVKLATVMGLYLGWLALGVGTAFVLVLWALGTGAVVATVVGAVMLGSRAGTGARRSRSVRTRVRHDAGGAADRHAW